MSDEQPSLPRCKHDYGPPGMCPLCKAESELAAPSGYATMTGYHIEVGYNSGSFKVEVADKLREVVKTICAKPETILAEVKRIEGCDIPEEYAESYREPWKDATVSFIDGEDFQVMQLASGGGESRDYKESMRRAFCRLVLEAMHRERMEVSVVVA
jgi:hypothetical protein